ISSRFPPYHFKDAVNRSLLKVGQVHRDLRQPSHQKSSALHKTQAAGREAHGLRYPLGNFDVGSIKKNVVGNKKLARAHDCCAGRRMHAWLSEVWPASRIGGDIRANAFKLSASDVFQVLSLG